MKPYHRWTRISILCLLVVSVFIPIFILSQRLKHFSSEGGADDLDEKKGFQLEDLSVLKRRGEAQGLNTVEEDESEHVKEPTMVIYKDEGVNPTNLLSETEENKFDLYRQNATKHENEEKGRLDKVDMSSTRTEEKGRLDKDGMSTRNEEKGRLDKVNMSSTKTEEKGRLDKDDMSSTRQKKESTPHPTRDHAQSPRVTNERVSKMKDQLVRAKTYVNFASPTSHLAKELKVRIKEMERAIGEASKDSDLPKRASQRMKEMETTLSKAGKTFPDCTAMVKMLRSMTHNAEDQVRAHEDQTTFLKELSGRTTPKGLHCISMLLTTEYFKLPSDDRTLPNQHRLDDPDLFHFAVFSDNILACGVVVNSTVLATTEQEKIVFHVVTDSIHQPAMSMWFLLNPPGKATIQVLSIDKFKSLYDKYDVSLQKKDSLDPRYASELNHLRFYLPDMFPSLDKIVLLDHDVVVQGDLTRLWGINMKDKANGAIETCHEGSPSFRQMDMYINFTDPYVANRIGSNFCTWAFGLNVFDLDVWRARSLTESYHNLLRLGNERPLFKAGSLPIGWLTFYNQTVALEPTWHVLGLGRDSDIRQSDVEKGAVIHFDGKMKPWLDIGLEKYKKYWWRHVYRHPFLAHCNIIGF